MSDPERDAAGQNDKTIQGRMQTVVDKIAENIKDCGNACDVWLKKSALLKVFNGVVWEQKLAAYTKTFVIRRMELEFALQIHTAFTVEEINSSIKSLDRK